MDISEFTKNFKQDDELRTQLRQALQTHLDQNTAIPAGTQVVEKMEPSRSFPAEMTIPSKDSQVARQSADAAIAFLKNYGVNTTPLESDAARMLDVNNQDIYGWNVVYKDGGWIVNGLEDDDLSSGAGTEIPRTPTE